MNDILEKIQAYDTGVSTVTESGSGCNWEPGGLAGLLRALPSKAGLGNWLWWVNLTCCWNGWGQGWELKGFGDCLWPANTPHIDDKRIQQWPYWRIRSTTIKWRYMAIWDDQTQLHQWADCTLLREWILNFRKCCASSHMLDCRRGSLSFYPATSTRTFEVLLSSKHSFDFTALARQMDTIRSQNR